MFCSFACAVIQAAPACLACGAKVLGQGTIADGRTYCSSECAGASALAAEVP